jgi:endogenous inhibitor of DNA gyrase (YacG/DUF329 family)
MGGMSAAMGESDRPPFKCPTCDGPVSWTDNPARPFCSLTCKLVDLGGWLDETYRVPGDPIPDGRGAEADRPPGRE